jgi:hypothetical protein
VSERLSGVLEGFYGTPWSWAARAEVASWCAERGMADYVYAPKDDPKHRERWRDPYDGLELEAFAAFAASGAARLGFAISPGLSMDPDSGEDRAAHDAVATAATGDLGPARRLFAEAAVCGAPGLEDEAAAWLQQVHLDAKLAERCLDALDGTTDLATGFGIAMAWQASRRATVSVFGPRCSVRPVIGQASDGTWRFERAAVTADDCAIDDLVRLALGAFP